MIKEISRTPLEGQPGVSIVQRVKGSGFEILKETIHDSGEIVDPNNELITVQTVTTIRTITKTEF